MKYFQSLIDALKQQNNMRTLNANILICFNDPTPALAELYIAGMHGWSCVKAELVFLPRLPKRFRRQLPSRGSMRSPSMNMQIYFHTHAVGRADGVRTSTPTTSVCTT